MRYSARRSVDISARLLERWAVLTMESGPRIEVKLEDFADLRSIVVESLLADARYGAVVR